MFWLELKNTGNTLVIRVVGGVNASAEQKENTSLTVEQIKLKNGMVD